MTDKMRIIETFVLTYSDSEYISYSDYLAVPGQSIVLNYQLNNSSRFAYQFVTEKEAYSVKNSLTKYHMWADSLKICRWLTIEEKV